MAIQPFNYAALGAANMGQTDIAGSFMKGLQAGSMPKNIKQEQEQRELANALMAIQKQYAPQMTEAELAQRQAQAYLTGQQGQYYAPDIQSQIAFRGAQTNRINQQAKDPFGGKVLPGVAGQVQGIEILGQQYGKDSPIYKEARDAFDLQQQATGSRINYQDVLAQTMPVRALTTTGKSIIEESNVKAGATPQGTTWDNVFSNILQKQMMENPTQPQMPMQGQMENPTQPQMPMQGQMENPTQPQMPMQGQMENPTQPQMPMQVAAPPASPEDLSNQYALLRQKNVTDTDTRKRNLFATNIEKTLGNINIDDLTQYAGIKGGIKMKEQEALASVGKESPEYDKFQKNLVAVDFLTSQVRQFYGDSIQPAMRAKLEQLSNPSNWTNNPKLAKQKFEQTQKILEQEVGTYRDALKSTTAFQRQQGQQGQQQNGQQQQLQQELQKAMLPGSGAVRKYNPATGKIE